MAEEWGGFEGAQLTNTSSFSDEGRTYGKGRGFAISNNNNNEEWGVGSKNGHYKGDNESSGFGTNTNEEGFGGGGGGWGSEGGENGFGGEKRGGRGDLNGNRDDSRPRGRGGRGGGSRGGFKNRDENGGGFGDGGGFSSGGFGDGGGFGSGGGYDGEDNRRGGRGGGRGGRGGRGGFRNRGEDGDGEGFGNGGGGFGSAGFGDGGGFSSGGFGGDEDNRRGGRGGRGGGGRESSDNDRENRRGDGGEEGEKPAPVTYIPPEISTEDSELFDGVNVGLNFDKYDDIVVNVTGENTPTHIEEYKSMGLRNLVLENIAKSGYTKPTPVQKYAIPIIMAGRDLMACAQTGSGKTAAFMIPIINSLLERPSELNLISGGCEPHCIVVSPTRELTEQIWRQALKFSKDSIVKCTVIYGGVSTMHQGNQVANGCHILVATPGRLLDFVDRRRISFASVRYVVLDEADRMLDMGFLESMRKMMNHETMVPKGERQTLMFSATFGEDIQRVAHDFLDNYLFLTVGIVGGACSDVEQTFYEVAQFEKRTKLTELLEREDPKNFPRTLVFVEMKKTADFLAAFLSQRNFPTTSMHGDRMQQQREEALRDFRRGKMPILVATAVAARGLDIKDVAHVVNFDMPKEIDEYVHRIGRTGRVGNRGKATSFFDPSKDSPIVESLVKVLSQAGQSVPDWLSSGGGGSYGPGRGEKFGGRDVRTFGGNDGSYDNSNLPNTTCDAEPEESWD